MHTEPAENRLPCELEIIQTKQHSLGYLNEIHLITGRTHQIRAQLAHLGCPILGDTPYGGECYPETHGNIFLRASFLSFKNFEFTLPVLW